MNIFQKLKIKLSGKERWRVLPCKYGYRIGDHVLFEDGKCRIYDGELWSTYKNREDLNYLMERQAYRKVN